MLFSLGVWNDNILSPKRTFTFLAGRIPPVIWILINSRIWSWSPGLCRRPDFCSHPCYPDIVARVGVEIDTYRLGMVESIRAPWCALPNRSLVTTRLIRCIPGRPGGGTTYAALLDSHPEICCCSSIIAGVKSDVNLCYSLAVIPVFTLVLNHTVPCEKWW